MIAKGPGVYGRKAIASVMMIGASFPFYSSNPLYKGNL